MKSNKRAFNSRRRTIVGLPSKSESDGDNTLLGTGKSESAQNQFDLFRTILESLPYPFYLIDASDYTVRLSNRATGPSGHVTHESCYALVYGKTRPCHEMGMPCPLEIIKRLEKPTVVEHVRSDGHGATRHFEVRGYPVRDSDNGSLSGILTFSTDITSRRLIEDTLHLSEARWRSLAENSPDTIFLVDREGTVIFVNRCPNGLTSDDVAGKSVFECISEEHRQTVMAAIARVFRTGKTDRFEIETSENSQTRWHITWLSSVRTDKGVDAVLMVSRDVTERKLAEKALSEIQGQLDGHSDERTHVLKELNERLLREVKVRQRTEEALKASEEFHSVILSQISDVLLITDDLGRFTYVSPGADALFGYTASEIMAMEGVDSLLGPGLFSQGDFEKENEIYNVRRSVLDKGGRPHTFLISVKHAAIGEGTTLYACRDITRLHQAEEALKSVNEELEVERATLREKNTALKEILGQIEDEKRRMASQLHLNINRMAIPILNALEKKASPEGEYFVALLRNCLSDITSPFVARLESGFSNLTPRELEICHMIKSGFTSKQIAATLNTSAETVLKQRKSIRRKLGIANKEVNLVTYLKSLEHYSLESPKD